MKFVVAYWYESDRTAGREASNRLVVWSEHAGPRGTYGCRRWRSADKTGHLASASLVADPTRKRTRARSTVG